MKNKNIRWAIYEAVNQFITAYGQNNSEILWSEYDLDAENITEMDEVLDFVKDKTKIQMFPISEINVPDFLSIDKVDGDYLVDCILEYENTKFYIVGEYNKTENNQYKFEYRYFDV